MRILGDALTGMKIKMLKPISSPWLAHRISALLSNMSREMSLADVPDAAPPKLLLVARRPNQNPQKNQ